MAYDWLSDPRATPYLGIINNTSAQTGVPAGVIANQIGAESGFNPNAVSPTGAIGLTQALPSTAAQPGYGVSPYDPTDPSQAIPSMVAYTNARGGYNQTGLAAYSGGSYSQQTASNILDGANSPGNNMATTGTDGLNSQTTGIDQYNIYSNGNTTPSSGDASGSDGTSLSEATPAVGTSVPAAITSAANEQATTLNNIVSYVTGGLGSTFAQYFGRFALIILGIIVITVGLFMFAKGSSAENIVLSLGRKTSKAT